MGGLNMKRQNYLVQKISLDFMMDIYNKQVKVNTKNKKKIYKFEEFYSANMVRVLNSFNDEKYEPGEYNVFLIKDPKYRIIMSQNISDKIINHAMANVLIMVLEPSLIDMNVATRVGKGTHNGIRFLKKYLNEFKGDVYALKFDISKYFYNINHDILKKLLIKRIKDRRYLNVLFKIIDSTNMGVNERIEKIKEKEIKRLTESNLSDRYKKIKEVEDIPIYKKGKGLPIGNMTSQIMAVFYLNELDHYIKEKLHIKYYIRYMNDGVLLCDNKEYLNYCLEKIEDIVRKYDLELNKKTKIIDVRKEGLDFLGVRFILCDNKVLMKVRNITKKRFKRKVRAIKEGKIDRIKGNEIINSYQAHFKWGNCYNLLKKYLREINIDR